MEDIKLSVPLPPLTAQIYMTAEDVKAITPEDKKKEDNVAALAEHPFVQRAKEDRKEVANGAEIIIARKLGKKEKKREREENTDSEAAINGDSTDDKPIRSKNKSKRRKGLKEKVEVATNPPVQQFDPYKPVEELKLVPTEGRGQGARKSMSFVTQK